MATVNILVVCVMLIFKDSLACFRENDEQTTAIKTGSTYYQECLCTEPGYSVQNLLWLDKDDHIINTGPGTDSNIYIEYQGDSINLHIPKVSKMMSGKYKCVTEVEGQLYTQTYNIDAYDPLYIYNAAETQYLVEGKDSTIKCEAHGDNEPLIHWEKGQDNPTVIMNDAKYEITPEGLLVRNVTVEDAGIYKCAASVISTGEEVDRFIKVNISTMPIINDLKAIPEADVGVGEPLSIDCIAEGSPQPEYVWDKISDAIEGENATKTWKQIDNTIIFENVKESDSGTYQCTAINSVGTAIQTIDVNVLVQPNITDFPDRTEIEGTKIAIICNATGRPEPNITVYFKKQDDDEEGEYLVTIPPATWTVVQSFQGTFICNASNEMGYSVKEMQLTVLHRPYFRKLIQFEWGWNGKTVNFSCVHKSNPPATISWRFQGNDIRTEEQVEINKRLLEMLSSATNHYLPIIIDKNFSYGIYECVAKNEYGVAVKTLTLKEGFAPPRVENASIVDITATSVLFSIIGPEEVNGPKVVGFTAQYDEAENYKITNIHVNRTWSIDRPFKLEKLKPNTKYYVKFAAVNDVGTGDWSDQLEFITLQKSVPEPPVLDVDLIHTTSECNQMLNWKAPEDNGEPIDSYILRYCKAYDELNEKLCNEQRIELATQLELRNLDCNTTYYLELVAHNSEGNSTAANISLTTPAFVEEDLPYLSAGVIIGIAVVVVVTCLILLDLTFFAWKKQGIIASCCYKKNKKKKDFNLNSRDKKGLLRDNGESADDSLKRQNKGHKEYEYNKTTGVITGKHSAV